MNASRARTFLTIASMVVALAAACSAQEDDGLPQLTTDQVESYGKLVDDATAAYAAKQFRRSAALYRRAAAIHDGNEGSWYDLACVEALRGQTALALEALERARDAGLSDATWATMDADLASLHETTEFKRWVQSIQDRAKKAESAWPTIEPASLADDAESLAARGDAWQEAIDRLSPVLGASAWMAAGDRLAAWRAASWDRVATLAATEGDRSAARLSAVQAIAGPHPMSMSRSAAAEVMRRTDDLMAMRPASPHLAEARLIAAQARLILAVAPDAVELPEEAMRTLERDLLVLAASLGEKEPALLATLTTLISFVRDEPTQRSLYGRFVSMLPATEDRRKHMLRTSSTASLYWLMEGLPDFSAQTLDGKTFTRDGLRGRVTLIDFWAIWCGPCRAEFPTLKKLHAAHHEAGFDIVGISLDSENVKDAAGFTEWCKENGVTWPQVHDGKGDQTPLALQFGVTAIPFQLLVDRSGRIVASGGLARGDELASRVNALME